MKLFKKIRKTITQAATPPHKLKRQAGIGVGAVILGVALLATVGVTAHKFLGDNLSAPDLQQAKLDAAVVQTQADSMVQGLATAKAEIDFKPTKIGVKDGKLVLANATEVYVSDYKLPTPPKASDGSQLVWRVGFADWADYAAEMGAPANPEGYWGPGGNRTEDYYPFFAWTESPESPAAGLTAEACVDFIPAEYTAKVREMYERYADSYSALGVPPLDADSAGNRLSRQNFLTSSGYPFSHLPNYRGPTLTENGISLIKLGWPAHGLRTGLAQVYAGTRYTVSTPVCMGTGDYGAGGDSFDENTRFRIVINLTPPVPYNP